MPQKSAFRLLSFSSVSSWLLMVVGHVVFATKPANHAAYAGIHSIVPGLSESVFLLTTFFFFRYRARLKNYSEMKLVDILSDVLLSGAADGYDRANSGVIAA